jgi:hypothetical protein
MAIKTGRYGQIKYDPSGVGGVSLVAIISLNAWKLEMKTAKQEVSCFGDTNKVYVPGLMDLTGSVDGFWNSADVTIFHAAQAPTPGLLELMPNNTEPTFKWTGLAYLDASIDCSMDAPKVKGDFMAAGPWTTP